jgi:hypothetical protein
LPKIEYYINHRNKREETILGVLKEKGTKMSEMDLVKIIYTVSVFLVPVYRNKHIVHTCTYMESLEILI